MTTRGQEFSLPAIFSIFAKTPRFLNRFFFTGKWCSATCEHDFTSHPMNDKRDNPLTRKNSPASGRIKLAVVHSCATNIWKMLISLLKYRRQLCFDDNQNSTRLGTSGRFFLWTCCWIGGQEVCKQDFWVPTSVRYGQWMTMDRLFSHLLLARLETRQQQRFLCRRWPDSVRSLLLAQTLTRGQTEALTVDRSGWRHMSMVRRLGRWINCFTLHPNTQIE